MTLKLPAISSPPEQSSAQIKMVTPAEQGNFICRRCGNCCRWPGYVRLSAAEVEQIAAFLQLEVEEFTARYTILTKDRRNLSLKELESGSCIFLDNTEPASCLIETVKPRQCRQFPLNWNFPGWENECNGEFGRE